MIGLASSPRADRTSRALLAYATALAAMLLIPPYLRTVVGPPQAFTLQEAADLFTPVLAIPLAWVVLERAGSLGRAGIAAFLVAAAVWIEGQGIHLAANAIGDAFSPDGATAFYRTVPGDLDFWLDETLSHWMWHLGWVAISVLVLAASTRDQAPAADRPASIAAAAGLVHGVTFFLVTVEGTTTGLGIPASILFLGWGAVAGRRAWARRPVSAFFVVSAAATLLGYAGWAAMNNWKLPEFSAVGLFQ